MCKAQRILLRMRYRLRERLLSSEKDISRPKGFSSDPLMFCM